MADFEIDGVAYKSQVFDGQLQFKIMLRLMPAFTAVGQVIEDLNMLTALPQVQSPAEGEDPSAEYQMSIKRLAEIVMPVSRELATLKDRDVDFIVNACMDVTEWRLPTGQWRAVRDTTAQLVAHTGNDRFIVRLKVTWAVIGENFSEMFAGFGVDLRGMMAKAVAKP